MEWWKSLVACAAAFAATSVMAHDDAYLDTLQAPHGGQLRMAGSLHFELVVVKEARTVKEHPIVVYVTDHAQNKVDVRGAMGSARLVSGTLQAMATLRPDGDNRMRGFAKYAALPGLTVEVTIALSGGEAVTARFTPLSKPAAAHGGPSAEVLMYKDPNCGCCGAWAEHLEANGFRVKTVATSDMESIKRRFAVPQRLTSCHTAQIGDYVIEGHVPASAIKRLLREKPAVAGLSVPGMPLGSPGMEVPGKKDRYDVVSFDRTGRSAVFESHR